jgi:hypothetical protein
LSKSRIQVNQFCTLYNRERITGIKLKHLSLMKKDEKSNELAAMIVRHHIGGEKFILEE